MKWPSIIQKWREVEDELPKYTSQVDKSRLAHTVKMIAIVGILLSFSEFYNFSFKKTLLILTLSAEHLFSMISILYYVNNCPARKGHPIESFFISSLSELFAIFEYSAFLAFVGKLVNVLATFAWNFMDLFVMIVAAGISSTFKQLNDDLFKYKGMVCFGFFVNMWRREGV